MRIAISKKNKPKVAGKSVMVKEQTEAEKAVQYLMERYKLGGSKDQHEDAYTKEWQSMTKRWQKMRVLSEAEAKAVDVAARKAKGVELARAARRFALGQKEEWHGRPGVEAQRAPRQ